MRWYRIKKRWPLISPQVISLALIISILSIIYAPICGCSLDEDSAACCQQHTTCEYEKNTHSDDPLNPPSCYNLRSQVHRIGQIEPSSTLAPTGLPAWLNALTLPTPRGMPASDEADYAQVRLKIPITPLYIMTVTYRI